MLEIIFGMQFSVFELSYFSIFPMIIHIIDNSGKESNKNSFTFERCEHFKRHIAHCKMTVFGKKKRFFLSIFLKITTLLNATFLDNVMMS